MTARTCDRDGCPYDAANGTGRCLQHYEPADRTRANSYIGRYDRPYPVAPVDERPVMTPALVEAKEVAEEAGFRPLPPYAQIDALPKARARPYDSTVGELLGVPIIEEPEPETVGFDEPPARGLLARVIGRMFG